MKRIAIILAATAILSGCMSGEQRTKFFVGAGLGFACAATIGVATGGLGCPLLFYAHAEATAEDDEASPEL